MISILTSLSKDRNMSHASSFLSNRFVSCGPGCALLVVVVFALLSSTLAWSSDNPKKALKIFFVDVEGGQATLFVTPAHQSLLIDTGWPGGRDADRIVAAAKKAGIDKID